MRIPIIILAITLAVAAVFAQPAIEVVPEILESDTMFLGTTHCYGHIFDPIFIKNTGAIPVELGLSGCFDYRHLDTIGHYGDTVLVSAHFCDSSGFPWWCGAPFDIVAAEPRFWSDGYYGPLGITLFPGDSVFLMFTVSAHYCRFYPFSDTVRISIYGRNGAEIDTTIVKREIFFMGYGGPAPPDSVGIDSICATPGSEKVFISICGFEPWMLCADFFHVYRDTVALLFGSQLDSNRLIPERGYTSTFVDSFIDTFWCDYFDSSKGICDTLVNLFYALTSIDTGSSSPDGFSESPVPSWCFCEYDQALGTSSPYGAQNLISIPCLHEEYRNASDLEALGVCQVLEWEPFGQSWTTVGYKLDPLGWIVDGPLQVSHVYYITGTHGVTPELFSTYEPGIIPSTDSVFTINSNVFGERNIIMLPFKTALIEDIHDAITLAASIEAAGGSLYLVKAWDNTSQTWVTVGYKHPIYGWIINLHIRPGMPYQIWVNTSSPINWPIM